jgi:hypothetical protein
MGKTGGPKWIVYAAIAGTLFATTNLILWISLPVSRSENGVTIAARPIPFTDRFDVRSDDPRDRAGFNPSVDAHWIITQRPKHLTQTINFRRNNPAQVGFPPRHFNAGLGPGFQLVRIQDRHGNWTDAWVFVVADRAFAVK